VARKTKDKSTQSAGLAFFASHDPAEIARALAWADEHATADASEGWSSSSDETAWSTLRLPAPRVHPRAPELFAAAAGVTPNALRAVLAREAYIDDAGALRAWPWYPEEDAAERSRVEATLAATGLAMPGELLDEPYEPAHYLARSGLEAIEAWLGGRGLDPAMARVDRVPVPPRGEHGSERYEGGMQAEARVGQAVGALARAVRTWAYVDDEEGRNEVGRRIDAALARLCDTITETSTRRGRQRPDAPAPFESPARPPASEAKIEAPMRNTYVTEIPGRVGAVFAMTNGALLVCDGAFVHVDREGGFVNAWPMMMGSMFARGDAAIVNAGAVLDLAAGRFLDEGGDLAPVLARMGLDEVPGTGGFDERTAPVLSGCGRYLLDVDESPFIIRLADGVHVAEGRDLERAIDFGAEDGRPKRRKGVGLVTPAALEVSPTMTLDGVRFIVRAGPAPARDGRSLAFALAGDRWRFLSGDEIREGKKLLAYVGVPIAGGAFSPDGRELWALSSDHVMRIDLSGEPRASVVAPLAPLLAEAAKVVPRG
jgi:hypothetical protein